MGICARPQVLVRYDARRYCAALAAIVAKEDHPRAEARVLAARALGHLVRLDWDCARYCLHSAHATAFVTALCSAFPTLPRAPCGCTLLRAQPAAEPAWLPSLGCVTSRRIHQVVVSECGTDRARRRCD